MYYLRSSNIIFLLILFSLAVSATSWKAAYPYTQHIEGQRVHLVAYSYDPYIYSPTKGITKFYLGDKLLYTIDKYYRDDIYTSNDGQYFAVVHTSSGWWWHSMSPNFNEIAIEVFKNGQPIKKLAVKDVVDTSLIVNDDDAFNWGWNPSNLWDLDKHIRDYKFWNKELNRLDKKDCLNGSDTESYCREWLWGKDSMKFYKQELKIAENSIYVQNNSLYILTNQGFAVSLDFNTMAIQRISIDKIIPDKAKFDPPQLHRKYKTIKLPEKFDEPLLADGRSLEQGIAALFGLSVPAKGEDKRYFIYMDDLVINRQGKCIEFTGRVRDAQLGEMYSEEAINNKMTQQLEDWLRQQTFETSLIPDGFDAYSFLCLIDLK